MTAVAALVAEAIAHADRTTTGPVFRAPRYHWISFGPGEPQLEFCRIDVRDAVAHYLATKVAEAEGRAARREERQRVLGDVQTRLAALRMEETAKGYQARDEATLHAAFDQVAKMLDEAAKGQAK